MNKQDLRDWGTFVTVVSQEIGHPLSQNTVDRLFKLVAIANAITRLNTEQCNGPRWLHGMRDVFVRMYGEDGPARKEQEWEDQLQDDRERLFNGAANIIRNLDATWSLYRNSDPRGGSVGIVFPSGRSNTWGGAECGWRVPEIAGISLLGDEEDDGE